MNEGWGSEKFHVIVYPLKRPRDRTRRSTTSAQLLLKQQKLAFLSNPNGTPAACCRLPGMFGFVSHLHFQGPRRQKRGSSGRLAIPTQGLIERPRLNPQRHPSDHPQRHRRGGGGPGPVGTDTDGVTSPCDLDAKKLSRAGDLTAYHSYSGGGLSGPKTGVVSCASEVSGGNVTTDQDHRGRGLAFRSFFYSVSEPLGRVVTALSICSFRVLVCFGTFSRCCMHRHWIVHCATAPNKIFFKSNFE